MDRVLELLETRDAVTVTELAHAFAVSEVTVRSDLGVLAHAPGVSVIVPGGLLRLPALSLVGDFAAGVLRTTSIGKGFFGARGVSLERGLMDLNPEEVRIKHEMADVCERVIGVFDHTKWHRSA